MNDDARERFEKGLRQLRYEKNLAETNRWAEELPLPKSSDLSAQVTTSVRQLRSRRWYMAGVAATLLLILATTFILRQRTEKEQRLVALAASTFTLPEILPTRGGGDTYYRRCISAGNAGGGGSQHNAGGSNTDNGLNLNANCLLSIPDSSAYYAEGRFLLGLLALRTEDYVKAHEYLTDLKVTTDNLSDVILGPPLYARPASLADVDWYRALALLGGGEIDAAQNLLGEIVDSSAHPHHQPATQLLDALIMETDAPIIE